MNMRTRTRTARKRRKDRKVKRDFLVLYARHMLHCTQKETAEMFHISPTRVHQIESREL